MDERLKKAFDFAADATKLLITLSTGIIAISITFSKDIVKVTPAGSNRMLFAAWIVYVSSIACGICSVLSMTANLEPKKQPAQGPQLPAPTIWAPNVLMFSILQIGSFLVATSLVIAHAIRNL